MDMVLMEDMGVMEDMEAMEVMEVMARMGVMIMEKKEALVDMVDTVDMVKERINLKIMGIMKVNVEVMEVMMITKPKLVLNKNLPEWELM